MNRKCIVVMQCDYCTYDHIQMNYKYYKKTTRIQTLMPLQYSYTNIMVF